jgi:hypothetical protein
VVTSAWKRFLTFYRRLPPSTSALLLILLAVLIGNALYLIGESNIDPISWTASISTIVCHITCGRPMIDPNVGFITQPLGHLSAMDLLHGHLPWWNYFEGLGQPLAGEMQAASLFPLTLLFAFPAGLLWFHICLELIAGFSTYFLTKRLGVPMIFATAAGCLFALNGTFAWVGNAVLNPIAFLPLLLLGIEMIYDSTQTKNNRGWYVAAIAVALAFYAGFPEVAYFNGLFAIGWAATRLFSLPRESRLRAVGRLGIGGGIGLLLSLPILIPFADFYKVANLGHHTAAIDGTAHISIHAVQMFFDPYVHGTLFTNLAVASVWGGIGGYFTASVGALALLGLFGKRLRPLRIYLAAWTVIGLCGAWNFLELRKVWNLIPLIENVSFGRYIMSSCELSFIVLAAFGLMDLAESAKAKRLFTVTTSVMLLGLIWIVLAASSLNNGVVYSHRARIIYAFLDAIPFIAIIALLVLGRLTKFKIVPLLVALVLVAESLLLFGVPSGTSAKYIYIDQGPITFLKTHQGQDRFLDFAVITPNWGSQFGLNELNAIDLPFPEKFSSLIERQLYPGLTPSNQFVIHNGIVGLTAQENELVTHFQNYENASVKYLVMPTALPILPALTNLGVTIAFHDAKVNIYQMPKPRAFFSTTSSSCTVTSTNVNRATVNCPSGGSTLVRTELMMAGWKAFVNGKAVTIHTQSGVYQTIKVPSGTSTVTYSFLPPHEKYAVLLALLAALFLIGVWVYERRDRVRERIP